MKRRDDVRRRARRPRPARRCSSGEGFSFPLGGCLDDDASVEITRTLPGGAPEVLAVVGLESIAAHEWTFTTTDVAPALEGDVEYTASFGGDTLHAPADAPSQVVSVTKRESILTLQAKPRSITVGQRSTLTAGLDGGASRTVILYEGEGVDRVEIGRVEADDAGLARLQVRPTTHTTYSAAYEGDSGSTAADSPAREVGVAALVKGAMKRYASKEGKYAIYRSSAVASSTSTSAKPKKPGVPSDDPPRVTAEGDGRPAAPESFTLGPTGAVTIYLRAKGLPERHAVPVLHIVEGSLHQLRRVVEALVLPGLRSSLVLTLAAVIAAVARGRAGHVGCRLLVSSRHSPGWRMLPGTRRRLRGHADGPVTSARRRSSRAR